MAYPQLIKRQSRVAMNGGLKAVILIGGPHVGTKFRPLSFEVPKPLFPVAGSPMIQHHIEACKKLSCIKEILVIGFYQQNKELVRFFQTMQREYGIPIRYLQEHCPLGTGGGIYQFRDQILTGNPLGFFVFNADICCDFPVCEMHEFQRSLPGSDSFVILGTRATESQAAHYGCIVKNPKTHEVLHYVEKPESFVSSLINGGAYLFTSDLFGLLGKVFQANCDNPVNEEATYDAIDLERLVLTKLAGQGKLFVFETTGFWSQIKTAGNAIYANRLYLRLFNKTHPEYLAGPGGENGNGNAVVKADSPENESTSPGPVILGDVRIHPTATVDPSAVLGPNVYVGSGVTIGPGARVKEAIVLDRAEIKEHCCVMHSIVGWDCLLGPWSRVEGYPSDPNPNDPHSHAPHESLFNKEGRLNPSISILGQGVGVQSELMILNSIVLPHKDISQCYHNQIIL